MDQVKIGQFIQATRKENNLTQEQLAEKLGVSQKSVSRWETGRNMPDISLFPELCKVLDINIAELMNGERYEGDMIEKSKVSSAAEGLTSLVSNKRFIRNVACAVGVLILTVFCMVGLYNMEFDVNVVSTDSLESAIGDYCFTDTTEVNVLESASIGNRLIVLYDRVDEKPGTSGVAILEKGIFGKYRFRECDNEDGFGVYFVQTKIKGRDHLIFACADELPGFVTAYGFPEYDGTQRIEEKCDISKVQYLTDYYRSPFLTVTEAKDGVSITYNPLYYDKDQNPYNIIEVAEAMGVKYEGSSGSATGSMEPSLIYGFEAVVLMIGIIIIRYFLHGAMETTKK
ncbi:MAG: helix-turn-helix transcriptional regulator [Eubacterium sp.]|nr:helix-turn-helix transcriptional regulator [Eubacterium sp.]